MGVRSLFIGGLLAFVCVPNAFAAGGAIEGGALFGLQIGGPIELTYAESKVITRENSNTFVRTRGEKPKDVQFLQIYVTPITHRVIKVDGVSEFRAKAHADAFVAKYSGLLKELAPSFRSISSSDDPGRHTSLELESTDLTLSVVETDLRKVYGRPGGYTVRIALQPTYGGRFGTLSDQARAEQKQIEELTQRGLLEKAQANGDLKGLR